VSASNGRTESEREDPYPSRKGGQALVIPRKDPVVHSSLEAGLEAGSGREAASPGAGEQGPLSPAQLELFEENGYLAFDAILSVESLREIQARADALREAAVAEGRSDPEVIREPESDEIRSIFAIHEHDPIFARHLRAPGLIATAEQILGGPVYIHQSRINYKPGFVGREFYWHSDFETWHVEDGMPRMRAFSLSISLTENGSLNGPVMVIPGSHRQFVSCPGWTPDEHYRTSLRRQELGVPPREILSRLVEEGGVESPTGPPGSALFFDCNLMHGSNGNITPFPRTNLFVVFNSMENALEAPFSGQPPRPAYIGTRDPKPLGRT